MLDVDCHADDGSPTLAVSGYIRNLGGCVIVYLIPLIFSGMAVWMESGWLVVGAVVSIFVVATLSPAARHQQSLCVFVMTGIGLVPVNIWAVWALVRDFDGAFILALMYGVLVYCIMFNVAQLVFGWLTRCIWKRQKRPVFLRIND